MEWNSINAATFQKRMRLTNVNIAATRADTASLHVAYLAAAVLGFLRCHPRRWSKIVTVSTGWKIFSTVFANSRYYQRAISDGSTIVGGANNRPCYVPGGLVTT